MVGQIGWAIDQEIRNRLVEFCEDHVYFKKKVRARAIFQFEIDYILHLEIMIKLYDEELTKRGAYINTWLREYIKNEVTK